MFQLTIIKIPTREINNLAENPVSNMPLTKENLDCVRTD